jgi:hypothetical protein
MMPQFELLGSVIRDIHQMFVGFYYMALPVCIVLAVVLTQFNSASVNHIDTLKRAIIATILLVSFPEISNAIIGICDGIALKIDDMSGLEAVMRMAQEKSSSYAGSSNVLLLKFNDLIIAILSYLSYLILYISRYLTIAMYYFFWILLSALAPLMILCYVFPQTEYITKNLFKGLIEVAGWKVIWAILSAMLAALAHGNMYQTEGSYLALIVLNFVIALAMLMTPIVMKSIVGEGAQALAGTLGAASVASMAALPGRIAKISAAGKTYGNRAITPMINRYQTFQAKREEQRSRYRY